MKTIWQVLLIGICLSSLSAAQNPPLPQSPHRTADLTPARVFEEEPVLTDQTEQLRARATEIQFRARLNRIAGLWNQLMEEYTAKNAFNVRIARELSKAFRELERTECWPKPNHEK
jgi:hypothetical protein